MKLRRALAVLALFAVAILPVAAAPVVVTGDVTTGVVSNFTTFTFSGDANLYAKAAVDDFTNAYVNIGRALKAFATTTGGVVANAEDIVLDGAYIQTDITKFFKVDAATLTAKLLAGYYSSSDLGYVSQSQYGSENVSDAGIGTGWMMEVLATLVNTVNVKAAIAYTDGTGTVQTADWYAGVYAAPNLGFGTMSVEAFYDQNKNTTGLGLFEVGMKMAIPMGDLTPSVGAGFTMNLATNAWKYGASIKAALAKPIAFTFAAGLLGTSTAMLNVVAVNLAVTPDPLIDIYAALKLTPSATDIFTGADIAAKLNIGIMDLYAGYVIKAGNTWAPAANGDGGPYLKATCSF